MLRNLVIAIHVIWIVVWTYMFISNMNNEFRSPVDFFVISFLLYIPPIVTLWYLLGSSSESKGEGLLSLWLQVRKKKLKDELKK
tara:strand:- start:455 stop:706 length:252 start_codon:yes stop_codon:yes gene_type:complete